MYSINLALRAVRALAGSGSQRQRLDPTPAPPSPARFRRAARPLLAGLVLSVGVAP